MQRQRVNFPTRVISHFVFAAALMVLVEGCRERATTVAGSITVDGQPYKLPADARGTIVFQPEGGRGTLATGLLDSNGQFKLAIGASSEVPPGKYHVTVSISKLLPPAEGQERAAELITPPRYASAQQSNLEATVQPGENVLSFNLDSHAAVDATAGVVAPPTAGKSAEPAADKKQATPAAGGEKAVEPAASEKPPEPHVAAPSNDTSK